MAKIKKKLTLSVAGKDVEQQDFSFTTERNAKCTATLEKSLPVPYKTKILLPYDPTIALIGVSSINFIT